MLEQRGLPTTREYALSADVWSLGSCCLALAAGRYIFRSQPKGARNALQSIWKLLGAPDTKPPVCALKSLRSLESAELGLPPQFWEILQGMLRINPSERMNAAEAHAALSALAQAAQSTAATPTSAPPSAHCSPRALTWQPFQEGCRIVRPRSAPSSSRPPAMVLSETSFLRSMVECWDACRGLALQPLTAVLALNVLARTLSGYQNAESVESKPLAVACALLAAKCLQFSPPSLRGAALTLRVGARAVASSEISVLCALRGDVLGQDFQEALALWGAAEAQQSSAQQPGPHIVLCIGCAVLAACPGSRFKEADAVARAILAGSALPDLGCARKLVRACTAGDCMSFFKPWPHAWTDFTSIMRTWASTFAAAPP